LNVATALSAASAAGMIANIVCNPIMTFPRL
jgi:hypothetical protein